MMADFTSAYQQALKIVRDFLENAKEFTKENEERLKLISEIAGILESMTDEESTAERSTNQCTEIIRELCVTVLFGIYIECTTKVADRSSMVNEIEGRQKEDKSSKLSETMQIKFDEVKHFLQKAKGRLEKIDDLLSEMVPKIRAAYKKRFKIPDEEIADLEMDASDVNFELKECKKHLDDAENAINLLKSDINQEVARFGIKIVAGAAGVASVVIIAGVTLPAAEMIRWQLKTIAEKLGGWLSYVAGLAGLSLVLCFGLIIDSHRSSYMVYVDTLESELRKARSEYKTKQNEIDEKVTKRMARMPKH